MFRIVYIAYKSFSYVKSSKNSHMKINFNALVVGDISFLQLVFIWNHQNVVHTDTWYLHYNEKLRKFSFIDEPIKIALSSGKSKMFE